MRLKITLSNEVGNEIEREYEFHKDSVDVSKFEKEIESMIDTLSVIANKENPL